MVRLILLATVILLSIAVAGAEAQAVNHVAVAQKEYAAVFAHSDEPCHWTDNYSFSQCMNKEITFTEAHLDAFVAAMRGVASDSDATNKGRAPDAKNVLEAFDKSDSSWREYRRNACALQYAYFEGATAAGPALAGCQLSVDRAYMKMLAGFFNLHELA